MRRKCAKAKLAHEMAIMKMLTGVLQSSHSGVNHTQPMPCTNPAAFSQSTSSSQYGQGQQYFENAAPAQLAQDRTSAGTSSAGNFTMSGEDLQDHSGSFLHNLMSS